MGPHSRVLISKLKPFKGTRSGGSWVTVDDHVLRGLSREQAEAEAASLGTAVVCVSDSDICLPRAHDAYRPRNRCSPTSASGIFACMKRTFPCGSCSTQRSVRCKTPCNYRKPHLHSPEMFDSGTVYRNAAGLKLERVWDLVETCVLEFSAV